jgi:DNA-binding NtrC family response regulator
MVPVSAAASNAHTSPATLASLNAAPHTRSRSVLLVTPDPSLRERLRHALGGLRWQVVEAPGGADAWMLAQASERLEAMLVDPWLPDLEVGEFLRDFHRQYPQVDLLTTDGTPAESSPRSPYHQELLYALRRSQEGNSAIWNVAPDLETAAPNDLPQIAGAVFAGRGSATRVPFLTPVSQKHSQDSDHESSHNQISHNQDSSVAVESAAPAEQIVPAASSAMTHRVRREGVAVERIPELIGSSAAMLEISRRIRLVAERTTPVLIEGPTGSGKELVAEALHRLSIRSRKPFVAINCAAIPEALLEAELFGHTRGAFTGAVHGRTGRIEAADGGTLFLDEIGEMPLALQSKLLRFFESGELQRIGDNETVKVDVRVIAATHQPLAEDAQKGHFRADLYYRLAVFLIRTPPLAEHMEDLPQLVEHFLERLGRRSPIKRIDGSAMVRLKGHSWPGNVRELEHVLERATILAGEEPMITASEIDFGHAGMG